MNFGSFPFATMGVELASQSWNITHFITGLDSRSRSRGPGLDSRGPGLESRGPGLDSRGQGLDSRGQGLDSRGPGLDSRGPGLDSRSRSRGPGLDSRGPGLGSRGPGLGSRHCDKTHNNPHFKWKMLYKKQSIQKQTNQQQQKLKTFIFTGVLKPSYGQHIHYVSLSLGWQIAGNPSVIQARAVAQQISFRCHIIFHSKISSCHIFQNIFFFITVKYFHCCFKRRTLALLEAITVSYSPAGHY